ncbi:MAG: DEAD/DEAH box helicase [Parachlamydia sp.]|nr:DEAD/DEAH box helicase [Parachlamydia sp.]
MLPTENGLQVDAVKRLLQADGPFSRCLKGFEPREQQERLMAEILEAYQKRKIALMEAGTGTGKSLAYLIPAVLWAMRHQEKSVISTNTINLQEQLLHKDIPLVLQALNADVKAVLVKGMNNYVCLRKVADTKQDLLLMLPEEREEFDRIEAWSQATRDGSRSSLPIVPSSISWEKVGAEADTCTKKDCSYFKECFFFKARRQMSDAQLLIVNHHLLCSDLSSRGEGMEDASLLPPYSRLIIDEAHNLEDVATDFFAHRFSQLEMLRNLSRLYTERQNRPHGKLALLKRQLEDQFRKNRSPKTESLLLRLATDLHSLRKDVWVQLARTCESWVTFVDHLASREEQAIEGIKLRLQPVHQTHPFWTEKIVPETRQLIAEVEKYVQTITALQGDILALKNESLSDTIKNVLVEIGAYGVRLRESCETLRRFLDSEMPPDRVRWVEVQLSRGTPYLTLIDADLDISKAMVDRLFGKLPTVTLCSATLTTNRQFDFVRKRLGLVPELLGDRSVIQNVYDSPFDYSQQALLAVPTDLPPPHHPQFLQAAVEAIWQAVQASRGNAFILFTSYSMLKSCYDLLVRRMEEQRYHPLKQGEFSRQTLIEKFKSVDRSILFGTDSFWEGVDVVGEALRCVIIVKLPFRVPSEPIFQARSQAIEAKGGDPFMEYALPGAIVKFKQGFGRLIRNKRDRGCVVCLDNRLLTKGYGRLFLNSLPACQTVFAPAEEVQRQMIEFYKKTYHLTK